jgi:hypothetical protein
MVRYVLRNGEPQAWGCDNPLAPFAQMLLRAYAQPKHLLISVPYQLQMGHLLLGVMGLLPAYAYVCNPAWILACRPWWNLGLLQTLFPSMVSNLPISSGARAAAPAW